MIIIIDDDDDNDEDDDDDGNCDDDDDNDKDDDDDDDDAQVAELVERMTSQAWAAERAQLVNDNLTSNEVAPHMQLQLFESWKGNWRTKD